MADQWQFGRSARYVTPEGKMSYPTVFEPQGFQGSDPKYSCSLLIDKSDKACADMLDKLEALHEEAIAATFEGGKPPRNFERWGITDGDELSDPTAEGHWVIKASNKSRPAVVDADKTEILEASSVYGGAIGRLNIVAKAYGTKNKGGVTFELLAVQKTDDGTPFGGAAKAVADAVADF